MIRLLTAFIVLFGLASQASAHHVNFAGHAFRYRAVLAPTYQSFAVPVTYSYAGMLPTGVIQSTWIPTTAGYPSFTTEYLTQVPVQVTQTYLAPQVSYGSQLFYGGGGSYNQFFDRTYLGIRSSFRDRVDVDVGRRRIAVGGGDVNVQVNERRGLFGLRRNQVNVAVRR